MWTEVYPSQSPKSLRIYQCPALCEKNECAQRCYGPCSLVEFLATPSSLCLFCLFCFVLFCFVLFCFVSPHFASLCCVVWCEESCAPCITHQKNCPRKPEPEGYDLASVDGPPCVLFSLKLGQNLANGFFGVCMCVGGRVLLSLLRR